MDVGDDDRSIDCSQTYAPRMSDLSSKSKRAWRAWRRVRFCTLVHLFVHGMFMFYLLQVAFACLPACSMVHGSTSFIRWRYMVILCCGRCSVFLLVATLRATCCPKGVRVQAGVPTAGTGSGAHPARAAAGRRFERRQTGFLFELEPPQAPNLPPRLGAPEYKKASFYFSLSFAFGGCRRMVHLDGSWFCHRMMLST